MECPNQSQPPATTQAASQFIDILHTMTPQPGPSHMQTSLDLAPIRTMDWDVALSDCQWMRLIKYSIHHFVFDAPVQGSPKTTLESWIHATFVSYPYLDKCSYLKNLACIQPSWTDLGEPCPSVMALSRCGSCAHCGASGTKLYLANEP